MIGISARLEQETSAEQASTLWNATRILMGLRCDQGQDDTIIGGITAMLYGIRGIEESSEANNSDIGGSHPITRLSPP